MIVISGIAPQPATTATPVTITVQVGTAVSSCTVEKVLNSLLARQPVTGERAGQPAAAATQPVTIQINPLAGGEQTIVLSGWPSAGTYRITLHSAGYENDEVTTVVIGESVAAMQTRLQALEAQVGSLLAAGSPVA